MAETRRFELKSIGRMFRILTGPGVPGGDKGRYQLRCNDLLTGISISYSANLDDMRSLHQWLTAELAYRAGAHRRHHNVR